METRILIAEDDPRLREVLCDYFASKGVRPIQAENGAQALEWAESQEFDAVLLDIMMPKLDGRSVCRALRRTQDVPILFLTALSDEEDTLLGYELGADDYITKPFAMRELLARVKANIRRVSMAPAQPPQSGSEPGKRLDLGRVVVDLEGATVYKDGRALELTQREYDLIRFLASQPGKVFSREALMEHVWNYEGYVGDVRAVDVAVRRLREKIEDDPASPKFILTKRGMGYLFGGQQS